MNCIVTACVSEATFIYHGNSLCGEHFIEETRKL